MLLKTQILEAQSNCKSARQCARFLHVSFPTYKKWAKYYGVYENLLNKSGVGLDKSRVPDQRVLEPYLTGEKQHLDPRLYIRQLITYGHKRDCCENCGYDERRIDGKQPLLLRFKDGNKKNSRLDNVQILCYNCFYVILGAELIGMKKRKYWTPSYFNTAYDIDLTNDDLDNMVWNDFDLDKVEDNDFDTKSDIDVDEIFKKFNK